MTQAEVVSSESVDSEGIGLPDYDFSIRAWSEIDFPHKFLPYDDITITKSFTVSNGSQNNTPVYVADFGGSAYDFFMSQLIYIMTNATNPFLVNYDNNVVVHMKDQAGGDERFWIDSWNGRSNHAYWDGTQYIFAVPVFFKKLRRLRGDIGDPYYYSHFFWNQAGRALDVEIHYSGIIREVR